ncbi:vacuolar protein sorting-associated protein [Verticillium alfalfae VaMs.102]|uniref:Vacuolar protein sorting-associated protein 54 n=1 Tax=Verticillium alfalfae (strain VaMs.102 / ATCC MYA-4576 / FGSC 10136) TaxID=526221 RepID=C9S534_VERA1|nr:vacuolar protein sorting-associated protein [Verticillium alfalfae VaMs.102]EEY14134.1 vacuolar protein sorting-associated protein [Verticillium alfalfae VaMs.102]
MVGSLPRSAPPRLTVYLAISTLLQPPIVRTGLLPHTSAPASSAHRAPTARDIPPVTLTNIPRIDPAEFKPYLSQVGALHLRPGSRPPYPARKSSIASLSSITSFDAPGSLRRSSGASRKGTQGPPPLSTIPNVYFDDDFHLENPRTFDVVSERSEVVRPAPGSTDERGASNGHAAAPRKALATNAILQEKLSWYMDTIEMHLISSISTASTTFFTALGSLRELHSEAAESVDRIKTLRQELEALDKEIPQTGLDIVQKRRRRENIQQLNDAVVQLRHIVEGVGNCENLVDEGQVKQALTGMDSLELLIAGEVGEENGLAATKAPALQAIHLRDLRGATALQGVNDDLNTLRFRVGKVFETKFTNVLLGDLRRHLETVSHADVLLRWGTSSMRARGTHSREPSALPTYLTSTSELRAAIPPNLDGLHRAKHIAIATSAYREAILREIRNLIRKPLPSSNDDDNESMMSASTMSGGRNLSSKEKSSILARNLRALDPKDAEDLLKSIYIGVTETLRRLTTQVKVLLDVASSLSGSGTSGVKSPPIRSPLASPNPDRHSSQLDTSAFEIQEEIHKAMDISNLVGQAVDVAQDKIVKVLKEKTRTAMIEGESFLLPNSAILCLEGLSQFMHLMAGIPSMTTDVATSLIAYLHLFNSRCTQLILGAGATRSAGLKNITTRHLALASQALSLIVTLIPHIREFVRRRAGSGAGVSSLMAEFDKVRRLFQEHQNSIYDKLVDIMSGRAAQHSKAVKAIDWDSEGSRAVRPYMETLAKETTTLHRVLTKHLPEGAVQMIMGPVFASYKDQLGTVFQAADPRTPAGQDSMRRDVDFLVTKLGKVDGFGTTGEHLTSIINSKQIEAPAQPAQPEPATADPTPSSATVDAAEAKPADEAAEKGPPSPESGSDIQASKAFGEKEEASQKTEPKKETS